MTTLFAHASQAENTRRAEATQASQQLDLRAAAAAAAQLAVEAAQRDLQAQDLRVTAKRLALEAAQTPPLRTQLAAELRVLEKRRNALMRALIDRRAEAALAAGLLELAQARHARAAAALAEAGDARKRLEDEDRRRTALKTGYAALGAVRADATVLKASGELATAQAKLAAVPAKLRAAARSRRALHERKLGLAASAVADADDASDTKAAADAGLDAVAAKAARAFTRAEAALAREVESLAARLTSARGEVDRLKSPDPALLAPAEIASLAALNVQATQDAADHEMALNAALGKEEEERRDLASARLRARLADPGASPATIDGVVAAEITALTQASNDRQAAASAFSAGEHQAMSDWQAAMSRDAWQALLELSAVEAELDAIEAAPPSDLAAALDTAEAAYVSALEGAEALALALQLAADAREDAAAALAALATRSGGLFGLFRGDDND